MPNSALPTSDKLTTQWIQSLQQSKLRVELFLRQQLEGLPVNSSTLLDAIKYGLLQGGKRIRPYLVYATGSLTNTNIDDLDAPAAALECVHSYSLIHDDLPAMDDDDLRRGKPTVHKQFNEATAILAGDSLLSLAFDLLANHPYQHTKPTAVLEMVKLLARHSGYVGMCGGQALDLANTNVHANTASNEKVTLADLEQMHLLKTGALIQCAVLMASHCSSDFSSSDREHLAAFAHAIGLAFQVQDDILDVIGETDVLGKPKGSDIEANKSTYVSILGLKAAQQMADNLYQQSLEALHKLPYNTQLLEAFASFVVQRNH